MMLARSNSGRISWRGRSRQALWLIALLALFGAPVAFSVADRGSAALLFIVLVAAGLLIGFAVSSDADRDVNHDPD